MSIAHHANSTDKQLCSSKFSKRWHDTSGIALTQYLPQRVTGLGVRSLHRAAAKHRSATFLPKLPKLLIINHPINNPVSSSSDLLGNFSNFMNRIDDSLGSFLQENFPPKEPSNVSTQPHRYRGVTWQPLPVANLRVPRQCHTPEAEALLRGLS